MLLPSAQPLLSELSRRMPCPPSCLAVARRKPGNILGVPLLMLFQNVRVPQTLVTVPSLSLESDKFICASWEPGEFTNLAMTVLFPPGAGGLVVSQQCI